MPLQLSSKGVKTELLSALGARHIAGASVTACAAATAVVFSAADGIARVFARSQMFLQSAPVVTIWLHVLFSLSLFCTVAHV